MEIIAIVGIGILQISVFVYTFIQIKKLKLFFPRDCEQVLDIEHVNLPTDIHNKEEFNLFIQNNCTSNDNELDNLASENVAIIKISSTKISNRLRTVTNSINSYLIKNRDAAADFNILKDITQRHISLLDNAISSLISVPLFLGLAGTFIGIILGLYSLDFQTTGNSEIATISTSSIQLLITGVLTAMIASLLGLILTLINSAWFYKRAVSVNDYNENQFYDLIQRDLLNKVGIGFSNTVNSLKDNLTNFNQRFGLNLKHYENNFTLLNDNLVKQKEFIDTVQDIGITKLTQNILNIFSQIENSSKNFQDFKYYQESLNKTISGSSKILSEYDNITNIFSNFNENLELMTKNMSESSDFYHEFKTFLKQHFSEVENRSTSFIGSLEKIDNALADILEGFFQRTSKQKDFYNEQWRKTVDLLNQDIHQIFVQFQSFINEETENIKKYILAEEKGLSEVLKSNKEGFSTFKDDLFNLFTTQIETSVKYNENYNSALNNLTALLTDNSKEIKDININLLEMQKILKSIDANIKNLKK